MNYEDAKMEIILYDGEVFATNIQASETGGSGSKEVVDGSGMDWS